MAALVLMRFQPYRTHEPAPHSPSNHQSTNAMPYGDQPPSHRAQHDKAIEHCRQAEGGQSRVQAMRCPATARLAQTQSRRKGIEQAFDKTVGCRLGFRPEIGTRK